MSFQVRKFAGQIVSRVTSIYVCHSRKILSNNGFCSTSFFQAGQSTFHTSMSPLLPDSSEISRYPIPPRESLPEDVQRTMNEVEEKGGFLPNVFQTLSYRPDEFRAFFNYYDVLMATDRGNLTKADKEMIVVATSSKNNCLYCIIAHGALHRIYSKNPVLADQIAANWRTADLDERQRAILEFAMDVANCEAPSEDRLKNLEKHGLDRDDAWDIGAITAFFAMSNRMAFVTNMKPNEEFYMLGRMPREKNS
ncbi:uncharacterized protein LOC135480520 [Liolophura sinensis]|uniref:uncharacterized protein LOC135480520 n=1 Tax=Liolophura sinensis TaxID=3198878 RepID=UPI003157FFB3